ncbi:hypothetical protein [uncultured Sphingomonas sp.]|uniref:hypothetical protein n=1 Tax=uncultured Sphingomonas sp. TaxID=158754 RepID=UPI0035C9A4BC
MRYVTVFGAAVNPYRNLWFVLPGLILLAVGIAMVFRPEWMEKIARRPFKHRRFFR